MRAKFKAKLFDGHEVTFNEEDVKEIFIEYGGDSIIIRWNNGNCERASSIMLLD